MPRLSDLRGPERAVARLRAAIAGARVHHAYLFTGPPGSGKRRAALALAAALNCRAHPGDGCGFAEDPCEACDKIAQGIHPDVVTLEREGAAQIVPIEAIRQQVIARIGLPPHEANIRVFVIPEASALQPAAANALLKTLEEPPGRTMFVLATVAPDQLLPTIRSRCQRIVFSGAPGEAGPGADEPDEAAARIAELAAEVAGFRGDATQGVAAELAARVAEIKGAAGAILDGAARRLHAAARAEVARGGGAGARALGERARLVLEAHTAVTVHNAHAQLALEALLGRLGHLPGAAA